MRVERVYELVQNLLFGFFPIQNVWVVARIIHSLDIVDIYATAAIAVQFIEGLGDELLAEGAHRASDVTKELVVLHLAIAV